VSGGRVAFSDFSILREKKWRSCMSVVVVRWKEEEEEEFYKKNLFKIKTKLKDQ